VRPAAQAEEESARARIQRSFNGYSVNGVVNRLRATTYHELVGSRGHTNYYLWGGRRRRRFNVDGSGRVAGRAAAKRKGGSSVLAHCAADCWVLPLHAIALVCSGNVGAKCRLLNRHVVVPFVGAGLVRFSVSCCVRGCRSRLQCEPGSLASSSLSRNCKVWSKDPRQR
jgi:hypothetical protein